MRHWLLALITLLPGPGCMSTHTAAVPTVTPLSVETLHVPAPGVSDTALRVRVFLPPAYRRDAGPHWPVLYLNDGQDAEAVELADTVAGLADAGAIRPPIVVVIDMPPDRMGAYGFSDRRAGHSVVAPTRYGDVGSHAHAYSEWLTHALVPLIDTHYRSCHAPDARALLGWSLGAANAFNIAWQYPEVFGRVGAFSPSFWLSTQNTNAAQVQRTRIAQRMVDVGPTRGDLKLFFAVGTDEETDDRDGDGVNDALDDTRDLVDGWQPGDTGLKGLRQLGYSVNADSAQASDPADVALYVLEGGIHRQSSWAEMLPVFLRWAYAPPVSAGRARDHVGDAKECVPAGADVRNGR